MELIAEQSGLGAFFTERHRLGAVDYFYRASADLGLSKSPFTVLVDKPDLRTNDPVTNVRVRWADEASRQPMRLHVVLKNHDEILKDLLVEICANQEEVAVSANAHITDFDVAGFGSDGNIIAHEGGFLLQGFNFGITAQGAADDLGPVFRGAPTSEDLDRRARLHPTAFTSDMRERSPGLGYLRVARNQILRLIGDGTERRETLWFESGGQGQTDVIRWIKKKLETPGVAEAYLVDPYLGSEAMQRVILRHGNETIKLTVVLSPGGIDPDADEVDQRASSDYIAKLVQKADDLSARLCGETSILHLQRGDGSKPAFHDRYLSIVDQKGTPTVYLFSNSLSKAAGDWPFAICEFNRIEAWRIHTYILELVQGKSGNRKLDAKLIWTSRESRRRTAESATERTPSQPESSGPEWGKAANALLTSLQKPYAQADLRGHISEHVKRFIEVSPEGIDSSLLGDEIVRAVGHREEVTILVSSLFSAGAPKQREVATVIDGLMLDRFLGKLSDDQGVAARMFPYQALDKYVQYIASIIANKASPTNFSRMHLNPILQSKVQILEAVRSSYNLSSDALETGICLVSIGLEIAIVSESAAMNFRVGMAIDYIHWLGRLLRSDIGSDMYERLENIPEVWAEDLTLAARQVSRAREVLGSAIEESARRVYDDPLVVTRFKGQMKIAKLPSEAQLQGDLE
jgi:hypothetical protein